jgi:quercetin dioxygenase-like cupin family protein
MHFVDLFSDADGESHWADVDVTLTERSFAPPAKAIDISDTAPATGMVFLRLKAGWDEPPHPTPTVQTLICVQGAVIVTASDGDTRHVGPGDIWRMADTHGKGHHTRVIGDVDFLCVIVQHP